MLDNLLMLIQKKMGLPGFAKIMGFTEKTARNKLNGLSEFTWSEAQKICAIWPEYKLEWLLEKSDYSEKPA